MLDADISSGGYFLLQTVGGSSDASCPSSTSASSESIPLPLQPETSSPSATSPSITSPSAISLCVSHAGLVPQQTFLRNYRWSSGRRGIFICCAGDPWTVPHPEEAQGRFCLFPS
ncbi:hypothetical protein BKA82DRAFT_762422 [Pisolithus tinctorius]|uniref:Uncharacterized protein n=1 Tax=Pisolithus tinctorius Marx 270 TaxID=870435 RepID=A0A0C3NZ57_PISTI|nr:hypothetical protein BKA82DRAFT_762422 [Pisolithus tinctorius]KIO00374.1 hypothetical protein M404DRAFT_762422 [Pisolithus tinctorius Marx 270]